MKKGCLHLIPNVLAEKKAETLPPYLIPILSTLQHFCVEEIKSTRRLLKLLNKEINIDNLHFYYLNEHENTHIGEVIKLLNQGIDVAYISEAGCPGIADPGQELVNQAHFHQIPVKPYVGPNSILLALMASGFNGQQFKFHGYLPNKYPQLSLKIKELEQESKVQHLTQIFIETPYRNHQLIEELIKTCLPETRLCVACNLTADDEVIISKPIKAWKNMNLNFHKKPCVFLIIVP